MNTDNPAARNNLWAEELDKVYLPDNFHSQWTPVKLAEEMCSKLDEQTDWSGDICVLYCCSLFRSVLKRVVHHHGMEHAIQHITFVASNMEKIELCRKMIRNSLEFKFIYKAPRELGNWFKEKQNMKFDVVIGNPPYQNGKHKQLYVNFINLSANIIKKDGFICLITPKTWLKKSKTYSQYKTEFTFFYLNIDECAKHFPEIGTSFSYFICKKGKINLTNLTVLETKFKKIEININDFDDLTDVRFLVDENFKVKNELLQKIYAPGILYSISGKGDFSNGLSINEDEVHKYPCYLSSKEDRRRVFSASRDNDFNKLKLAVAHILEPKRAERFSLILDYNVGRYARYFLGSKIELNNIQQFFNSNIYVFIDSMKRYGRYAYLNIPKIDFLRTWSDKELYEYFNLTQEEIDLIESTVK